MTKYREKTSFSKDFNPFNLPSRGEVEANDLAIKGGGRVYGAAISFDKLVSQQLPHVLIPPREAVAKAKRRKNEESIHLLLIPGS